MIETVVLSSTIFIRIDFTKTFKKKSTIDLDDERSKTKCNTPR